ncbi:hypothetical protein C4901_15395 [Acidiferrobacter sp. SPIII_3]|jgi:hypothetical protein|uniref:hypothetical protein n=1 Tax=Acidiferrobacter sp. SPIII_3 TaxID=1281578 RepID=UPI000D730CCB|nr:hypothetical protein [Acidiferrobacter sp. SPIII_3]AWP24540.1 hypothetical protein C4901_15395 [Acidiferrobacter sp. SPIII_3]
MDLKPKRLMARMARHQEAVIAARLAGLSWNEIGERLGASGAATRKAFVRAQAAMQSGKLVPLEQTPLPDPPVTQATAPVATVPRSASLSGPEKKDEGDFMSRFSISRPTK